MNHETTLASGHVFDIQRFTRGMSQAAFVGAGLMQWRACALVMGGRLVMLGDLLIIAG